MTRSTRKTGAITRRGAIGLAAGAAIKPRIAAQVAAARDGGVVLKWLGDAPPRMAGGVSWGVPWPRGAARKDQTFTLTAAGERLPLQTWPLAYWPDGSLKWSGFATVAGPRASGELRLAPGNAAPIEALQATEFADAIEIDTGRLRCIVPRSGSSIIGTMAVDGRTVAANARLAATLDTGAEFSSLVRKASLEQNGPVRAVVKIEGVHKSAAGAREWLPFTVRLYFYAGAEPVRLIHTIVFDGDEQKDFLRSLGLVLEVPMHEQPHNRHVRFSGEGGGLWSEPLQPLTGRRSLRVNGHPDIYAEQLAGKRVPNREDVDRRGQELMRDWAVWDSFKLVQPTADGFIIQKRTNPQSCWLQAAAGRRASGLVFVGDVSGGLGVSLRNFWQSYPASLEVRNATGYHTSLCVWLWSPDAPAMDLRHYDTKAHGLEASYEDVQPGFSTPHGIARTSELTLYPEAAVPAREESVAQARAGAEPPLLLATPEYLHSVRAFGIWSLPDRSTPFRRGVEDQLDRALAYYQKEVEQRHWYGFWDYGDVMHAYDPARHTWRYDIGGFAWDNTELASDMWLWYSFLRTGRADIFRMAEAMTRHTSEVDTYHLGRFAMLGSRHNVRHWGCGAKEARISQAAFRRFLYYLTTDERVGDIMHEVADADRTFTELDPMRLASPTAGPKKYPARLRGGPDWLALAGNWMTEWERTGNTRYRDKIIAGMDSIAKMPYAFLTGPNSLFGYDPATGALYPLADDGFGGYNLQVIMGGAELVFELNEMIDHAGWHKAWLQYCRLTSAPKAVVARDMTSGNEGADASYAGQGRLAAYAYMRLKNPAFAKRALRGIDRAGLPASSKKVEGLDTLNPIEEYAAASTNSVAQSSLNAIEVLEMCRDLAG